MRRMPIVLLLTCLGLVAGCASNPEPMVAPQAPDESRLASARAAIEEAAAAGAERLAPGPLRDARQRLTAARALLYQVAGEGQSLSDEQRTRIEGLVQAATLDARYALSQTQARAVQTKLDQLQAELDAQPAAQAEEAPR
ncbi:DUF4398 domain-containing protein [Salinisphaera sp. P385]|uniref:DUF4398 domain-containing protein n=1 Tax=Spectribacter acetivorans TaxID=3075603 RepID=A0ABU3B589_9GAMM|nr:DUF4398 domain-containing protein [Salinisphaera sp. P385]MDT0617601.1 DUF4398 domain-containing protein [Salinisphaera sp. P385]